jgi:hypothetical protein
LRYVNEKGKIPHFVRLVKTRRSSFDALDERLST